VPFGSASELGIHFRKHGHKFGARTAADYERMADAFMFGIMNGNTQECVRPGGRRRCRLDFVAADFGVALVVTQLVITFYPQTPRMVTKHGGPAGLFAYECARHP